MYTTKWCVFVCGIRSVVCITYKLVYKRYRVNTIIWFHDHVRAINLVNTIHKSLQWYITSFMLPLYCSWNHAIYHKDHVVLQLIRIRGQTFSCAYVYRYSCTGLQMNVAIQENTIFWHSIWHIFWHSIWHVFEILSGNLPGAQTDIYLLAFYLVFLTILCRPLT